MPSRDKLTPLDYPLGGIDRRPEFQEQEPGTTVEAVNVRGVNPVTLRARGGSRAGISHYIPTAVPADTAQTLLIQHLNVIVDPQAPSLPQEFGVPDDTWVEDPLNPGTFVPPGGWGPQGGSPPAEEPDDGFPDLCEFVSIVFDYAPGFAFLESDPGTTTGGGVLCQCNPESTIDWIGLQLNYVQITNIDTMNQLLFEQGYIGEGADAIDSITVVLDGGACAGP